MISSRISSGPPARRRLGGHLRRYGEQPVGRWRILVALGIVCGVAAVGCTIPPAESAGSAAPTSAPIITSAASSAEYETELSALEQTLGGAFHEISAATPFEPLAGAVDSAAGAVRNAAQRLRAIEPPSRYVTAHADLLAGLDLLATELSGLGVQVRSQELCAAQPVLATVATLRGVEALRSAAQRLGAAGADLTAAVDIKESLQDRRGINGSVLRDPGSGHGKIEVENGTDDDAVVTLTQDGRVLGIFYVARGKTAELTGIPDGGYEIFFVSGVDWDGAAFTRSCAFQRFEEPATFVTKETASEILYTWYSLTLHPVAGGTARTTSVPPESFPRQ